MNFIFHLASFWDLSLLLYVEIIQFFTIEYKIIQICYNLFIHSLDEYLSFLIVSSLEI